MIINRVTEAFSTGPGYFIDTQFLSFAEITALNTEFDQVHRDFFPATTGNGDRLVNVAIRSDQIFWFDPTKLMPAQTLLWERLNSLRMGLNRSLYLGCGEIEGHFSEYPPGGFYKKHFDRFRSDDARVVSLVIYLNAQWETGDGGELLIYDKLEVSARIHPIAGTMVCFLSDLIEHEVALSLKNRRSISGWMRRCGPRGPGAHI